MSGKAKTILAIVIVAIAVAVFVIVFLVFKTPTYSAVYLRTGDIYFGKLIRFPVLGLRNVHVLQVNQNDSENPVVIQRFTNVFWGPQDWLKLNRDQIVWIAKLDPASELSKFLLARESGKVLQQVPAPNAEPPVTQQPSSPVTPAPDTGESEQAPQE